MTHETVAALRELDSCALSDALDTLGLPGAATEATPRAMRRERS